MTGVKLGTGTLHVCDVFTGREQRSHFLSSASNLSNCYITGNVARINYDMLTHELESERGSQFQLSYRN